MIDITRQEYNKFEEAPNLPYNCVSYLMDNNELIWKLLKYDTGDAWKMPNLTKEEKGNLVYPGNGADSSLYRVFLDTGQDNTFTRESTVIRISWVTLIPSNYIYGYVIMGFEVYSHYKINHLSNYQPRTDIITQQFLEVFNGSEIKGLGRLYFDYRASSGRTTSSITGQLPFKGKITTMCNWISN